MRTMIWNIILNHIFKEGVKIIDIKCPYCGSNDLSSHGHSTYKGEYKKRYICNECKKIFKDKVDDTRAQVPDNISKRKKKEIFNNIEKISKKVVENLEKRERFTPLTKKSSLKKEVWLQMISDFHYGLRVKPVEIGGMFEYNSKIAKRELDYLLMKTCRILEYHLNRPDKLVITFLGDMIDNAIMRDNQMASIEFQITDQIMGVVELYTDYIIALSKYFKEIKCFGVYGNHGRITQKLRGAHPKDNFDRIVYWSIQERLKGIDNISLEFTEAQHMLIEVEGWRFWLEHGDTVRSWVGIPFYGAKREKNDISDMLNKFSEKADYVLVAHFHQDAEFENIYMNGSFVGGDIFSVGKLRRMSMPSQTILGVNQKHGVVWKRRIQLIDEPKNMKIKVYK